MLTNNSHRMRFHTVLPAGDRPQCPTAHSVSRRDCVLTSTAGGFALGGWLSFGGDLRAAQEETRRLKIKSAKAVPSVCPYCAVSCGQIVSVRDNQIIIIG